MDFFIGWLGVWSMVLLFMILVCGRGFLAGPISSWVKWNNACC